MEVDRISYIFGSFSRRRQSQEIGSSKRRSTEPRKISHDRSNSTPHTTKKSEQQCHRTKSVCNPIFDENTVKCPLCQRHFVEPRVLPCLHTFCMRCLQELEASDYTTWTNGSKISLNEKPESIGDSPQNSGSGGSGYASDKQERNWPNGKQRITCPTCGTRSDLPPGGVSMFPLNYVLQHRLVLATVNANVTRLLCDLCTSDVPAASRCTVCALSFCSLCTETHKRQRSYAQHEVLSIEEARRKGITRIRRQIMCSVHPEQELNIFCSTCYQVVCHECIAESHRAHSCEAASQAAKSFISSLRQAVDKAKLAAENSAITLTRLQIASKKIETQCNQVQTEVDEFINDYLKAIENHRKNLNEKILEVRQEKLTTVANHREQLQKQMRNARDVVAFIDELLNEGTDVEVLSFAQPVLKKLESCTMADRAPMELKISESLQFLPHEAVTENRSFCPLYGVVTTQVVSPRNCVIHNTEGLTNVRIGKTVEIVLETRDKNNTCLERGGETVAAEILYRDSLRMPKTIQIPVDDLRNGKYSFSFTPDVVGKLLVYVFVKGQPIKNNPFSMTVHALRPHQGTFHCCSFCSSNGSKEFTCGCGGKMPGGYKGCGHGHEGHPGKRHWSCCGSTLEHSECSKNNSSHYQFTL